MFRIYIDHGEAYGNLGDEAMLISATQRIREELNEVEFIIPCRDDEPLPNIEKSTIILSPLPRLYFITRTLSLLGKITRNFSYKSDFVPLFFTEILNSNLSIFSWRYYVDIFRDCDALYSVGAANLNDFTRFNSLFFRSMLISQFYKLGIPSIVSSQAIGPLELTWTKTMVRRAIQQSTYFSLRDGGISKDILASEGFDLQNLPFVGDEAFSLSLAPVDVARLFLQDQGIDPDLPFALFHFREKDYTQSTISYYSKIAEAFDSVSTKANILFIPMSYWKHSGNDEECGKSIKKAMLNPEKFQVLRTTRNVHLVRRLVDMASWTMALSYHVQVFSLSSARPMALLSSGKYYSIKARGMQMLVGNGIPLIDIEQTSVQELCSCMEYLDSNPSSMIDALNKSRSLVQGVNDGPIKALAQTLRS